MDRIEHYSRSFSSAARTIHMLIAVVLAKLGCQAISGSKAVHTLAHARVPVCATVTLVLPVIMLSANSAANRELTAVEHVGKDWGSQILFYPFEATREEKCGASYIRVVGPDGQLPAQLVDVKTWHGTDWVRTARLVFADAIAALEKNTYRASWDETENVAPETDLKVRGLDSHVTIETDSFGVRLPVGNRQFATPATADTVPGPVAAMRLADGTWFGGSRMVGNAPVSSWSADIVEQGPVLARWQAVYTYEDGMQLTVRIELAAGASQALWETRVENGDDSRRGWELTLNSGLQSLILPIPWETQSQRPVWKNVPRNKAQKVLNLDLNEHPPGLVTKLTPWRDWWTDFTQTSWTFKDSEGKALLRASSFDPGRWVEPLPPGTIRDWSALFRNQMPLKIRPDGRAVLVADCVGGERAWLLGAAGPRVGRAFNKVKDYVLEWPRKTPHPHLFLTAEELAIARPDEVDDDLLEWMRRRAGGVTNGKPHGNSAMALGQWLLTGDDEVARRTQLAERLKYNMSLLGRFDKMRHVNLVCSLYDAVVDSQFITEKERPLLRAQMAYLGYVLADPSTWSNERGYRAYPPNMSISYALNLGTIAATISDHPMAETWAESAVAMMDAFLEDVGPAGEWPESVSNYAHVSTSSMLPFAIMARNAGLANFVDDPRMKRLLEYLAKQYTPPDPRHTEGDKDGKLRLLPPVGRAAAGGVFGLAGAMARATLESDPDYSAVQQWMWARTGYSRAIANNTMGGWEWVYMNPDLPEQNPRWTFDYFPETGVIMRQGMGTPAEWYVYLMAENVYARASESGGFPAIFARGTPISSRFAGGYAEREEIFISRVLPARDTGTKDQRHDWFDHDGKRRISDVSALPRQQYARGEYSMRAPRWASYEGSSHNKMKDVPKWPDVETWAEGPVTWNRQILFVRGDEPDGLGYLVLRDSVYGNQPTIWQFWTVTEKIGTPEQVRDRQAFLEDAPGNHMADARRLPDGSRYTAIGQFGLDIECYVAAPSDTPRHTLRWGTTYHYAPSHGYEEYQDMLHLQRPGDGTYFVAIVPRKPNEEVPTFTTLGDGSIIELKGTFGRDLVFLSDHERRVELDYVSFLGTAGSVQDRGDGLVLSLGAPGKVSYGDYWMEARCPASLRRNRDGSLVVDVPGEFLGVRWVEIDAPGDWKLPPEASGVTLGQWPGTTGWLLQFDAGCSQARLVPEEE